jgi:hypothetical protein
MTRIPYGKTPSGERPSKPAPQKNALPKGIKIKLAGRRTTRQLRAMLHDAVNELEAAGIEHVSGINLYVTPIDKTGAPLVMRRRVPDLVIDAPYPVAAEEYKAP